MNEHQRHVKARQDILSGKTPDKRIFVHMEDLEEKKKREEEIKEERERKNDRMDALKEAKTPWFCPNWLNNQLSYIKDQIESIEDWKEQASKPLEVFDSVGIKEVELQKEKWSQNKEQVETMSKEALEELNKMKTEVEEKLNSLEV